MDSPRRCIGTDPIGRGMDMGFACRIAPFGRCGERALGGERFGRSCQLLRADPIEFGLR